MNQLVASDLAIYLTSNQLMPLNLWGALRQLTRESFDIENHVFTNPALVLRFHSFCIVSTLNAQRMGQQRRRAIMFLILVFPAINF